MVFEVIDHLAEIVRQSIEVDLAGHWTPPEMVMRLLVVCHLLPQVGARFLHDSPYKLPVVSIEDLVLEETTFDTGGDLCWLAGP